MAELNFDKLREERGVGEGHTVTLAGVTHTLPPVLSLTALAAVAKSFEHLLDDDGKLREVDMKPREFLATAPGLIDALASELGDWVKDLDQDEFMAVFHLYDLGGVAGEEQAS